MRRSAKAIETTFTQVNMAPVHPTKKNMKPKVIMPLLPNVEHWGYSYTHVVIDKVTDSLNLAKNDLTRAFVANVEQKNNKMTCDMWAPPPEKGDSDSEDEEENKVEDENDKYDLPNTVKYRPIQSYDLDVIPLKEEDQPHINFCLWIDPEEKVATYIPISSRVQLSTGRPPKRLTLRKVARRGKRPADLDEINERRAEVDEDIAQKIGGGKKPASRPSPKQQQQQKEDDGDDYGDDDDSDDSDGVRPTAAAAASANKQDDDDSDDDEEETFGGLKTIVAAN